MGPATPAQHYGHAFAPWSTPPPPLAEDATDARQTMRCGLCPRQVWPGDRIARLTDGSGRWAHLACIAASATIEASR